MQKPYTVDTVMDDAQMQFLLTALNEGEKSTADIHLEQVEEKHRSLFYIAESFFQGDKWARQHALLSMRCTWMHESQNIGANLSTNCTGFIGLTTQLLSFILMNLY